MTNIVYAWIMWKTSKKSSKNMQPADTCHNGTGISWLNSIEGIAGIALRLIVDNYFLKYCCRH